MKEKEINVNELDVIRACTDLMGYCLLHDGTGADFDIVTPKGIAHCSFDFSIDMKKEND